MFKKNSKLKPGPQPDKNSKLVILRVAAITVLVAVVIVGGVALYRHFNNPNSPQAKANKQGIATLSQVSNRYNSVVNKSLKNGDYQTYEIAKLELADSYISSKDYTSAQGLLTQVKQNVPKDKLMTYYYQLAIQVDKYFNDTVAYNADLQALITLLKAQGETAEAEAYQSGKVSTGSTSSNTTQAHAR